MSDLTPLLDPRRVRYIIFMVFLTMVMAVPRITFSFSETEVAQVYAKAEECQMRLSAALDDGKDVSDIVSMMMQAKALADAGRLSEADELLDEVLLKFDQN